MKLSKAQDSSDLKIAVFWGDILYDTVVCSPKESVTIGRSQENTFILDSENFKLVDVHPGKTAELYFNDKCDGHIRMGKELLSLGTAKGTSHVSRVDSGLYCVRLSPTDKADIVLGHVSFYLDWVKENNFLPHNPLLQKQHGKYLLLFLLLLSAAVVTMNWFGSKEEEKPPERLVFLEPRKVKAPPADVAISATEAPSKAAMGETKTKDGGAQKGDLGKAATKVPDKISAVGSLRKANLGSLLSGLTSVGANAPSKNSASDAVPAPIEQAGTGGFSTEGLKTGGGGKSVGIGRTQGQGEGGFSGTGRLGLYGNSAVEGTGDGAGGGATRVAGGLDRSIIESVIRRRLDRIRLCYERQLNFYPKLAGKVAVHFAINKDGAVLSSAIAEDTMKNPQVSQCILAEVKTWSFPPPEGGTIVNVDYPFVFESSAKAR